MKLFACILLLCIAAFAAATENDAGHFIPRAFYTLDAEGHKSDLHFVHPNTAHYLRRLRRSSSYMASSSSSSSTVSGSDGGPVFFSSLQSAQHTSDTDTPAAASGAAKGRRTGPVTHGHVVHTVGTVDNKGRVKARVSQGHF